MFLQGHFEYNFNEPGEFVVEVNVIAYFDNSSKQESVSLLYDTDKKGLKLRDEDSRPNDKVKMAIFQKKITPKQNLRSDIISVQSTFPFDNQY